MEIKNTLGLWIFVILGFLLAYAVCFFVMRYPEFRRELKYINMEIKRSDEVQRRIWKKKKKKLFRSLLPFVRY